MNTIEVKVTRTETRKRIELTDSSIRALLKMEGHNIPVKAAIFVEVPGGGDWSNTSLDISAAPVIIAWSEVSETYE